MSKCYKLTFLPLSWECEVSVDVDFDISGINDYKLQTTSDAIHEMIEFWGGWEFRLKENKGDYLKTFLQQLGHEIAIIKAEDSMASAETVISEFNNREGWFPMDGSWGIKILEVDDFEIDATDFLIEEVKNEN